MCAFAVVGRISCDWDSDSEEPSILAVVGVGLTGDVAGGKAEERDEGICCTDVAAEEDMEVVVSQDCCR